MRCNAFFHVNYELNIVQKAKAIFPIKAYTPKSMRCKNIFFVLYIITTPDWMDSHFIHSYTQFGHENDIENYRISRLTNYRVDWKIKYCKSKIIFKYSGYHLAMWKLILKFIPFAQLPNTHDFGNISTHHHIMAYSKWLRIVSMVQIWIRGTDGVDAIRK